MGNVDVGDLRGRGGVGGHIETVYGNMPLIGLGKVDGVVPVNKRGETAAERLGGK